ncbi:MAG: YifB family Mg chelatase-like AAA ATPase [Chloroflexi bacterium]|nr:YifB family Mg chelatase-like AAA ATPase [Chloroflexota bacterium]
MLAKVRTCAVVGLEGLIVEAEVDVSPGLPSFTIVGLADTAVQEARERVRAAIRNSGYEFPVRRLTVNLAPANLKKEGPAYDLPIAVGLLTASEQVPNNWADAVFLGELGLDGHVRHTTGVLPMVAIARDSGIRAAFVPMADAKEAALVSGIDIFPVSSLGELASVLRGEGAIDSFKGPIPEGKAAALFSGGVELAHVRGQEHAKRAVEVASAGGHNLLMVGLPGSGKTLLARTIPTMLPSLTPEESLEVTKIYSVSGLLPSDTPLIAKRPFRAPHYTISQAGLVGGGRLPHPGEVSLAHRGVLFLDELPEFGHSVLEVLRQPLEDKVVTISRAQGTLTFPANFMLVGAMNPCPCGYYGDKQKACTCSPSLVAKYQRRVSGPMMDRIDLFVEVPRVEYEKLMEPSPGEGSAGVRGRVETARERQRRRFQGTGIVCNAEMGPEQVWQWCQVEGPARNLLQLAMKQLNLSARAFHRVLKVSRTIADLAGADTIGVVHLAEALQYRPKSMG